MLSSPRRPSSTMRDLSLQRNDAGVWLCEYPGLSFQRSPVCACSLVSSLLLSGATMSQQSSLTQSAHSVRQVLTAYSGGSRSHRRCWTARPDLRGRRPSRLVATASKSRLIRPSVCPLEGALSWLEWCIERGSQD